MFVVTVLVSGVVAVVGIAAPDRVASGAQAVPGFALRWLEWFFWLASGGMAVLCAVLALSPVGSLRLGADDERPEFTLMRWLAMLFPAGMGSGLLFWGSAEPVWHRVSPPPGPDLTLPDAARPALTITYLRWGIHAWAIYGMSALVLAWFEYRRALPSCPAPPSATC